MNAMLYCLEVTCPLPPQFANSVLTSFTSGEGTGSATYHCQSGYVFADTLTSRSYQCTNNLWSSPFIDCTSECMCTSG